jgi:hypothetical protein
MSFTCAIQNLWVHGQACSRIRVPLTVIGSAGEVDRLFRFDSGCDITTVSEDVAILLGLPVGGRAIGIRGSTGTAVGRLVPATFRFPPDEVSGLPERNVSSTWMVVAAGANVALLSLHEVHSRFYLGTDDTDMYFTNR